MSDFEAFGILGMLLLAYMIWAVNYRLNNVLRRLDELDKKLNERTKIP